MQDPKAILLSRPRTLKRPVRAVIKNTETVECEAVLVLTMAHRTHWTYGDWVAELRKLDNSALTVAEWLGTLEATP